MPGPKNRRPSFSVIALRAFLGFWALYVTIGATYGFASMSTVNHLTGVLHDNLNEGKNNYDSIQVDLVDGIPGSSLVNFLIDHFSLPWAIIVVGALIWAVRKFLRRGQNTAPAAAHTTSTP